MYTYYVYITTNSNKDVLYIGVTNNITKRIQQHRNYIHPESFTACYNVFYLIYYETFHDVYQAIAREKQLKGWSRSKKETLINKTNPNWNFIDPPAPY